MEAAATQLSWSVSKLYRLENGKTRIISDDLADMLDAYGTATAERDALARLCRDARRRGWWASYTDVFTGSYIAMEAEASVIRTYAQAVVPGIFQVPGYARAVITATRPGADQDEVARRVEARAARQQVLFGRDRPPRVHAVLDEAVLWRVVGGPCVHRAQLEALGAAAERTGVTVQVLPFTAGANAGMDGKFTPLEFADDPPVAYVEGLIGDVYLETGEETNRFACAFELLAGQALALAESARMISEMAREAGTSAVR
jgi:hypothetical protein